MPIGARNIYIRNDNPKNFLSLKDAQSSFFSVYNLKSLKLINLFYFKEFYLNGDFKIQYSRIFHIESNQNDFRMQV